MGDQNLIHGIKTGKKVFIIAEIGQNHQGDLATAKKLILLAKNSGVDCVKFQKTCLEEKFTKSALQRDYTGLNSWGATYGEHKTFLEFSNEQFLDLQKYAKNNGILFTASAMDEKSLECLETMKVPFIKIGSGDSNNFPLIDKAARTGIPLVISTGMIDFDTVKDIYQTVSKYHKNFALLHCVSSYPAPYEDINLNVIFEFQKAFPDIVTGYSGHELGTHITICAAAMGAKIIERHITLDKNQKGSDHKCSLDPTELKLLVEQIRTLELALGEPIKKLQPSERACYEKLGKSLVYAKRLEAGHVLRQEDIRVKVSVPKGIDAARLTFVLNRTLERAVEADEPVQQNHFTV